MSRAPCIGIDLGTCKCCIGVWQNGKVEIIPNDIGQRTTPSYLSFTDEERLIGDNAKNKITRNPTNTLYNIKRLVGRKFGDKEIQDHLKSFPFKVIKDPKSDRPLIQITQNNEEKTYYVEEILAFILYKLKQDASKFIGKEIKEAIITVPVYFNLSQRKIIKDAATISGLNALRILSDTSVFGFTYFFEKKMENNEIILVFDLGGGHLNISVLDIEEGLVEVKSVNGITHLGGEDFDNRLVEYCTAEFNRKNGIDIKPYPKAMQRVKKECEKAKIILSSASKTTIVIENLIEEKDLEIGITREQFENLCMDLFKKCLSPLENVLKDAKISKKEINEIVLIGGSTKIPKIQSIIQEFFEGKKLNTSLNHEEAIAYGAAVEAAIITNIKAEKIEKMILMDVIPFSLGAETTGGVMNVFIPRNSVIPTKKTQEMVTYADNQTSLLIQIFEGERQLTKDNRFMGKFTLEGIPPMPRGQAKIEITFDIDCSSNLNVTAVEKSSGISNKIFVDNEKDRLSKNEIDDLCGRFANECKYDLEQYLVRTKEKIDKKFNEIREWINSNPNAPKNQYEEKLNQIKNIFEPLVQNF